MLQPRLIREAMPLLKRLRAELGDDGGDLAEKLDGVLAAIDESYEPTGAEKPSRDAVAVGDRAKQSPEQAKEPEGPAKPTSVDEAKQHLIEQLRAA